MISMYVFLFVSFDHSVWCMQLIVLVAIRTVIALAYLYPE